MGIRDLQRHDQLLAAGRAQLHGHRVAAAAVPEKPNAAAEMLVSVRRDRQSVLPAAVRQPGARADHHAAQLLRVDDGAAGDGVPALQPVRCAVLQFAQSAVDGDAFGVARRQWGVPNEVIVKTAEFGKYVNCIRGDFVENQSWIIKIIK